MMAKFKIKIMTKQACLPRTIICDNESVFMLRVVNEVAEDLEISQQLATTKLAQTIGMFERTHASLQETFKIETGGRRPVWHK